MGFVSAGKFEDLVDPRAPGRAVRRIATAGGRHMGRRIRAHTPVSADPWRNKKLRRPGTLRASTRVLPVEPVLGATGMSWRRRVINDDPIAPHVNYPTKPHIIRPRADRQAASVISTRGARGLGYGPQPEGSDGKLGTARLAFRIGGRLIFAAFVRHPGTRGVNFMEKGAAETEEDLPIIAAPEVERMRREIVQSAMFEAR